MLLYIESGKEFIMRVTKNDMARQIVTVLYNLADMPDPADPRVLRLAKKRVVEIERDYKLANKLLLER